MKSFRFILLLTVISNLTFGQGSRDSLIHNLHPDSLQTLLSLPDTLLLSFQKADSIRQTFTHSADTLQTQYHKTISAIELRTTHLTKRIDSLQHLDLSTTKYTKSLDSLNQHRLTITSKLQSRLDSLKSKTIGKLTALDLPPEYKKPLEDLTKNMDKLNLNSDMVKIPKLEIPGYSLPDLNVPQDLTTKASQLTHLGNPGDLPKLSGVETPAGDLGKISEQAQAYQGDIQQITQGNIENVQAIPETIEEQASKIDGMEEVQQLDELADLKKGQLDEFADPNKAKEAAKEIVRKAAIDHFAGKQEQLKAAMDKISKYKQKYSSVSSIKDLPKRPPNPMKGKPFIERVVPGLYLQYQRKNFYLLDVNPYIGYKLSGRFTAGLGWNHRYSYDSDSRSFTSRSRIFGPRGYVDFKLGKGFIAHVEGEAMNSFVPSTLLGNPDNGRREWVWSFMMGIKKEYRIYKNLKGTALIQYNLFNRYYKAPYVDRLNSRIGFEYVLKKRKKAS